MTNESPEHPETTPRIDAECRLRVWHSATSAERRGEFESRCEQLLDPQELASADRFRRTTTRNQHVVGRAMARRLLGKSNVVPQQIQFVSGEFGKPQVVTPPEAILPFNIAHTDGLVLCGVADRQAELVGVDVESLNRRTSTDLAERYFAKPEIQFLRSKPLHQQQYYFLRIWTLKEAFIKAIGTGLHTPLADFAFDQIDTDYPNIRFLAPELDRGQKWNFVCFRPREGFIAAAAIVAKEESSQVIVDWHPFEELIEGGREYEQME